MRRFADGIILAEVIEGFAASIDTAAWVILLLMFELETCGLDDRYFTRRTTWTLHGLRAASYVAIIYAFYGYFSKLIVVAGRLCLHRIEHIRVAAEKYRSASPRRVVRSATHQRILTVILTASLI